MQPPARAPHLPPGPVKPFPTVMVASVMLGLIVVGVLGWIGKDLLKGDPVKAAVESYEKLRPAAKKPATSITVVDGVRLRGTFAGGRLMRVCAQHYNRLEQYERLAALLPGLLATA